MAACSAEVAVDIKTVVRCSAKVAADIKTAVRANDAAALTLINHATPLTAAYVSVGLIAEAIKLRRLSVLRWLGEHGLVAAADLDNEWHSILASGVDIVRWARSLGSRPAVWDHPMLRMIFTRERISKISPAAELLGWAADDPAFVALVRQKDFRAICSLLLRDSTFDAVRVAARHFDIVPSLVRYASKAGCMRRLVFLLDSGIVSREHCLASGGALLHAVRRKRPRLSLLKRKFALTRSDFASAGLSATFSDDL